MSNPDRIPVVSSTAFQFFTGGLLFLTVVGAAVLFFENVFYFNPCEFGPLFGTASSVVLLGMFGLYRYAYKFYRDEFYWFLSVGWFLNAIYILFESFFIPVQSNLNYGVKVYVIGLITVLPFYFACFVPAIEEQSYSRLFFSIIKWLTWLGATAALGYWIIAVAMPEMSKEQKFAVITFGGIPFVVWTLTNVGRNLGKRLDRDIHKEWSVVFPLTFYLYAALQPLYLIKLWPGMDGVFKGLFFIALLIKVINSIAALTIIKLDTANVQKLLEQRTVLEDLGALTASIEHDIKNPLEVINRELKALRNRYQANDEIVAFLKRLDEQRLRIFATTQIIPVLRGQRDYYERFMEKSNIGSLISASIRAVKREMRTGHIIFRSDERITKPEERALYVRAYRPMLEQAIVNILKNAVEAIDEAKRDNGLIDIQVKAKRNEHEMVLIEFRDNGCGIPEEHLPEVTKLFMSTRTDKKPNSGIGLFITKRILRVHGGNLLIKNNEERGVTVTVLLPRVSD